MGENFRSEQCRRHSRFRGTMMTELNRTIRNGRMLKNTGSWLYCGSCDRTVAYLCYTTYLFFRFRFNCLCGSSGEFDLSYEGAPEGKEADKDLYEARGGRLCCPDDGSPLFTIVHKHLESCEYTVCCRKCGSVYGRQSSPDE